jgi:hypothetical protein
LKNSRDHFKFIYGSLTGCKLTLYDTDSILNIPIFSSKFQKKIKIKEKNSLFEKKYKNKFSTYAYGKIINFPFHIL